MIEVGVEGAGYIDLGRVCDPVPLGLGLPTSPGLGWPGPDGAMHLVRVPVRDEPGLGEIVFATHFGNRARGQVPQLPNRERVWQLAVFGLLDEYKRMSKSLQLHYKIMNHTSIS